MNLIINQIKNYLIKLKHTDLNYIEVRPYYDMDLILDKITNHLHIGLVSDNVENGNHIFLFSLEDLDLIAKFLLANENSNLFDANAIAELIKVSIENEL